MNEINKETVINWEKMKTEVEEREKWKNRNIWWRIWGVQSEVKPLVRDEKNKFQNYMYFEEDQVLKVLNPLLKKYRLALALSDDHSVPVVYEKEDKMINIKYRKRLEAVNIDNPVEILRYYYWVGASGQDLAKVKGSAETYATKYILSKFFLIRVIDENDPELTPPKIAGQVRTEEGKPWKK